MYHISKNHYTIIVIRGLAIMMSSPFKLAFDRNENVLQPTIQQDQPSGRMHEEVKVPKGKAMSFANVVSVNREGKREMSIQFTG